MEPSDNPLLFLRATRSFDRARVRQFAHRLRSQVAGGKFFLCLLTDDHELRRLNRQFLGLDYPADVLSFPSLDGEESLGQIAISVQRAAEQANRLGHPLEAEISILMLHGLLHLMGMDHETDRGKMARAETRWRRKLELPPALTERVRQ